MTEGSRLGEPELAAEVLLGDAVVAFCGYVVGNWMSSCRNDPIAAVRVSHSTV